MIKFMELYRRFLFGIICLQKKHLSYPKKGVLSAGFYKISLVLLFENYNAFSGELENPPKEKELV